MRFSFSAIHIKAYSANVARRPNTIFNKLEPQLKFYRFSSCRVFLPSSFTIAIRDDSDNYENRGI